MTKPASENYVITMPVKVRRGRVAAPASQVDMRDRATALLRISAYLIETPPDAPVRTVTVDEVAKWLRGLADKIGEFEPR